MAPFLLIPFLLVAAAGTHHDEPLPPQVYWNKTLPYTPIPSAIHDILHHANIKAPGLKSGPYTPVFEKDMLPGIKLTIDLGRTSWSDATFLARQAANSIPFASTNLSTVLTHFSIDPTSPKANAIKKTINECEASPGEGENKYCATSLESMIEYATSTLATRNVMTMSTTMSMESAPRQKYTIMPSSLKKMSGSNFVACHAREYPYIVFYCHMTSGIKVYRASMIGEDGTMVKGVAVCHHVLVGPEAYGTKIEVGINSICHFLPPDHIVWSPKI